MLTMQSRADVGAGMVPCFRRNENVQGLVDDRLMDCCRLVRQ